jgi:hypothetical protein
LAPEQRLASRIVHELGLQPPVPIEQVAQRYADVELDTFPADWDAVILGLGEINARPRIILNSDRPPVRRRFTLAHELGHHFIGWHVGMIACHTLTSDPGWEYLYRATEAEANRFASELLIPRAWLDSILASDDWVPHALGHVETANVSAPAGCLALTQALPPGHVLALIEDDGTARYVFRSEATNVAIPRRGQSFELAQFDELSTHHERVPFGNQTIFWWYFEQRSALLVSTDARTSPEILEGILAAAATPDQRLPLIRQINGIIGSANNMATDRTAEGILAVLRQRFTMRPELVAIRAQSDFPLFLSRKAEEIAARE